MNVIYYSTNLVHGDNAKLRMKSDIWAICSHFACILSCYQLYPLHMEFCYSAFRFISCDNNQKGQTK